MDEVSRGSLPVRVWVSFEAIQTTHAFALITVLVECNLSSLQGMRIHLGSAGFSWSGDFFGPKLTSTCFVLTAKASKDRNLKERKTCHVVR
jgi:hypothetical protein